MHNIEAVWSRIKTLEGERFETKTGKEFTFEVTVNTFYPSRTDYSISKGDFEKALGLVPLEGPGEISDLVRGSAYVWAVLHDHRVRKGEW